MKITKFGHCCLLLEEYTVKILIDPGNYSTLPKLLDDLDFILITHDHQDHLDIDILKRLVAQNPEAQIITNRGTSILLEEETLPYFILEPGKTLERRDIQIKAIGEKHAEIYQSINRVDNSGFLIDGKFFYPGDAFTSMEWPIETLALPVSAPWLKLSDAIDYAKALKPSVCIPVHDGNVKVTTFLHKIPQTILEPAGIAWRVIETGQELEV
jgi:L-ascorbate metabolism protein UlaG (beta-lactamase superfamily)